MHVHGELRTYDLVNVCLYQPYMNRKWTMYAPYMSYFFSLYSEVVIVALLLIILNIKSNY